MTTKYQTSIVPGIIKPALFIAFTAVLSRGIGFLREVIYANSFGLNEEFDIYLVGAVLPVLINSAVFYLAQNFFIPGYHQISIDNKTERHKYFNNNFWLFTGLGLVVTIVLIFFHKNIIDFYLWNSLPEIKNLTTNIFILFILSIPLNAGYSILSAYMQAELRFKHPALSQLFLNIPIIILVLFFHNEWSIYTIPVGYLIGNAFQLGYLYYISGSEIRFSAVKNFRYSLKNSLHLPLFMMILIEVLNQLHVFIDRYFFNFVETGGIAALSYASVLFSLPVSVFSFALATAVFPFFARTINSNSPENSEQYLNYSLRIISFILVPVMMIFFFNGDIIIKLIYQHGNFTSTDTQITFNVLKMYSLSLVFYASYAIINKMIYSSGLIKELLTVSIILIILKTILNFLMVDNLKQDGLALSSSISYVLLTLSCYFLINKKINMRRKFFLLTEILFFISMSFLAYFISSQIISLINQESYLINTLQIILFILIYLMCVKFIETDGIKFKNV